MHWPKISEKKKLELEHLKLTIKTSPLRKVSPKSTLGHSVKDGVSHNGANRATSENNEENS